MALGAKYGHLRKFKLGWSLSFACEDQFFYADHLRGPPGKIDFRRRTVSFTGLYFRRRPFGSEDHTCLEKKDLTSAKMVFVVVSAIVSIFSLIIVEICQPLNRIWWPFLFHHNNIITSRFTHNFARSLN